MNRLSIGTRCNNAYLVIIIASIGFMLWRFATPKVADDFPYSHCLLSTEDFIADTDPERCASDAFWKCQGDAIASWSDVVSSSLNHYLLINGRLSNMLALASAMIPDIVVNFMHTLMFALMLVMIMRLSTHDRNQRPGLTLLLAISIWIVMPWEDCLASSDFMINYVWSSALMLTFIYRRQHRHKGLGAAVTISAGFVAAMMHEGFAISFLVPVMTMLIKDLKTDYPIKEKILNAILPTVAYLLATAVVMSSPALWRLLAERHEWQLPINFFVYNLGVKLWPFYLALMLSVVARRVKRKREVGDDVYIYSWVATGLISCVTAIISSQGDRALWPAYLASIIICISRLDIISNMFRPLPAVARRTLFVGGLLLLMAWQSALAYYQLKFSRQQSIVESRLIETRRPLIYVDVSSQGDIPWWLFEIPQYLNNSGETARLNLYASVMKTDTPRLMILPEKYHSLPLDSLPAIDGNAGLKGVFPTYYSPRHLPDTMRLTFGHPAHFTPAGSVNPIYSLQRQLRQLCRNPLPTITVTRRMEESMIVTDMDTAWFYRAIYLGRSLTGLPLLSIDTIP